MVLLDVRSFYQNTHTMKAKFYQKFTDRSNYKLNETTGTMLFESPNKFHWWFNDEIHSATLNNSKQIFQYDTGGMSQVDTKNFQKGHYASVAEYLAGGSEVLDNFTFKNISRKDSLAWVKATPKNKGIVTKGVLMGFKNSVLHKIVFLDGADFVTHINFQ